MIKLVRRQAIFLTNAGLLIIWNLQNRFQWNLKYVNFHIKKWFENVICEMAFFVSVSMY